MAKINLSNVSTLTGINSNIQQIEDQLNQKVLYRNNPVGEPNTMESSLDMNGERIFNLPVPLDLNEPARLADIANNASATALRNDLANTSDPAKGAALVSFTQSGTGAVARKVQDKLRDCVSLKDFGAKLDGVTNDTAAVLLAIASNRDIYHPGGVALIDPIALSGVNYFRLRGVGRRASLFKLNTAGTLFKFSNSQDVVIEDVGFTMTSGLADSSGVQFDTGSGICSVKRSQFDSFSASGLRLVGTSGAPLSGMEVEDCLFLSCGDKQLHSLYSNDFWYQDNQFGIMPGGAHANYGAYLENSNAGTYKGNYHWNNVVGFAAINSNYNRVEINRFEESDQQGAYFSGCVRTIFSGNTIHTNSQGSSGTYDNVYFSNCDTLTMSGNQSFDWSGGATSHRHGYYFDAGCVAVELKGNSAPQGWVQAPYGFHSSLAGSRLQGDMVQTGVTGGSAIPAATTTFFGDGISNFNGDGVAVTAGRQCQLYRVAVYSSQAPGVGQSYTYTLMKNGVATGTVLTISGGASFESQIIQNNMTLLESDSFSIKLETSAGAATAFHRCAISQADY